MNPFIRTGRSRDAGIVILLFAFHLLFLWPCVVGPRVFAPLDGLMNYYPWAANRPEGFEVNNSLTLDGALQFMPWRIFLKNSLEAGEVPLWNPYSFSGQPFAANGQSAVFYPLNFLTTRLFDPGRAAGVETLVHLFVASAGCYLLLRLLGASRPACGLAALAFSMNGWFVGWMQISSHFRSAVWAPLLVLFYELAARRRRPAHALLCGAAGALSFLGGQFQTTVYLLVGLLAYGLFQAWVAGGDGRSRWTPALAVKLWAWASMTACGLAAVQLIPSMELARVSHREVIKPALLGVFFKGLPLDELARFLTPDFFGSPAFHNDWGGSNWTEYTAYIGAVPLFLALLGFRSRMGRAGLFVMFAAVVLALGTPAYAPIYYLIPGMKLAAAHRAIGLAALFSPLAVAAGCDRALRDDWRADKAWTVKFAASLAGATAFFFVLAAVRRQVGIADLFGKEWLPFLKLLVLAAGFAACLIYREKIGPRFLAAALTALVLVDLAPMAWKYNTRSERKYFYPPTRLSALLEREVNPFRFHSAGNDWILSHSLPMAVGLAGIEGYESLYPRRYQNFLREVDRSVGVPFVGGGVPKLGTWNSPALDMLNVEYLLTRNVEPGPGYEFVEENEVRVYRNLRALPRAYVAPAWEVLPETEILKRTADLGFRPAETAYLEKQPSRLVRGGQEALGSANLKPSVRVVRVGANEAELDVRTGSEGILVYSDAWYPGWKAWVDGAATPVMRVNYILKGVRVEPGAGKVTFRFRPAGVRLGFLISMAALLFVHRGAIGAGSRKRRRAGRV